MLDGYRLRAAARGICFVAVLAGLALSHGVNAKSVRNTRANPRPTQSQAEPKNNLPPSVPLTLQDDIHRIAGALEAVNQKQPSAEEKDQASRNLAAQEKIAYWAPFVVWAALAAILGSAATALCSALMMLGPQRLERNERAKVLTYRLLPAVVDIHQTAVRVRKAAEETNYGMMLADAGQLEMAEWSFRIDAQIPSDIMSELHVLPGETAVDVGRLYYCEARYNDFIHRNVPHLRSCDANARNKFVQTFDDLFDLVESLASSLERQLLAQREKFTGRRWRFAPRLRRDSPNVDRGA